MRNRPCPLLLINQLAAFALLIAGAPAHAALLAHEPFTNTVGTAIIGTGGGSGFTDVWQANSSTGLATNTSFALNYVDGTTNALVTSGGAAFFQGSTSSSAAMQPIRPFGFSRGTNGTDGTTTWISFLIARLGPVNGSVTNPYLRGANLPHDLTAGALQKLAIGNGSGAATNTVALIPQGSGTLLRPSSILFGGMTNFVVVRIDHVSGGNDHAWLFVNPALNTEPATNSASANSLNSYDYSFDRLRVFAGGQSSVAQPYAEIILDEYRIGETFADVTPYAPLTPPLPTGPIIITNAALVGTDIVLAGIGGTSNASYAVLASTSLLVPSTSWSATATNNFDGHGNFICTNPVTPGPGERFFRLFVADQTPPPPVLPTITSPPTNVSVVAGQPAAFAVTAAGTAPLSYQWLFNTNAILSGANTSNYNLGSAQPNHAGGYSVRVSNAAGAITSVVATLTVFAPPAITTPPASQSVIVSNNVNFTVAATGTAPLRYQWFFNTNTTLANATNAAYSMTSVQTSNAGTYSVRITNNYGAITSAFATLTVSTQALAANYYVATSGSDSNPGTNIAAPFATLAKAASVATAGKLVYIRGGTYAITSGVSLNKTAQPSNKIRFWAYPGEVPVVNASGASSGTDAISISGDWYHVRGLTVTLAGHNGIKISGDSNIVENCVMHDNGNTGLHLTGSAAPGPTGNLILNCDAYRNYDPPIGGNADGFSAKWDIGPGNVFDGCRAWENSDDGWDLWMGTNPVLITNCWAFRHGIDYWFSGSFNGNGNGFKLGGNYVGAPHTTVRCISFGNAAHGYDQNNNISGQTVDQNTGWNNGARNFSFKHGINTTPHIVRNNLSFAAPSIDDFTSGTVLMSNSWEIVTSPAVSAADVQSVDESVAILPRNVDGSLPVWPFLRPVAGGRLVDKGVDIGQPFNSTAPDLGAYETP